VSVARLPVVAVVGRQNVGKSTLVNRLLGRREAIADHAPGVTRDRVEVEVEWGGRRFVLVDTGGYLHRPRGIEALVTRQAARAAEEADVVVLVVDAKTGPLEEDDALARRLRRFSVPVVLVANKVDSERDEADATAFVGLGLGEPVPVSALHGRGAGDLLDRLVGVLPGSEEPSPPGPGREPRYALVGRPNVGKSSLFNRLVGQERSVVFEQAGTTRDAVDAVVEWPSGPVRFVDTAGFRRPSRARGVEYYGFLRTERAIERADVAIVVLDAADGFTTEDRRIASKVIDEGRALILVANKWDLVQEKDPTYHALVEQAAPFARAPVHRGGSSAAGARRTARALDAPRRHRRGQRLARGDPGRTPTARERALPLRDAGIERTAGVRAVRSGPPRAFVRAFRREPTPQGVPARRRPDQVAVPRASGSASALSRGRMRLSFRSGRPDSNRRPSDPQSDALTKLRHGPSHESYQRAIARPERQMARGEGPGPSEPAPEASVRLEAAVRQPRSVGQDDG
jgi:GTPase